MDKITNVILIPICGFANRLRFISSCIILFKQYNIIPTILWKTTEECNIDYKLIFEDLAGLKFINSIPKNYLFFGHIHLAQVIEKLNGLSNEIELKTNTLIVTGSHEFKPNNITDLSYISDKSKFYRKIKWNNQINLAVDNIKVNLGITDNNFITAHYRCIDKRFDSNDLANSQNINFNQNSPIEEFKRYINQISNRKVIFISNTNSVDLKNVLKISNKDCDRNNKSSMIQSIVEFRLMCDSKLIIGSYFSSFSDEASFFNIIPKIIPIDINKVKITPNYHCSGLSFIDGILALNYSTSQIIDCLEF